MNLPPSMRIRMRPVWARRQRRAYFGQNGLQPPTEHEIRDAIQVLGLPDRELRDIPAIHAEAQRILDEATAHSEGNIA